MDSQATTKFLVSHDDQLKTTFKTKWGTYAYKRIPFGLINAGETFQRAMDVAFRGLIGKLVVVYLDDVTVFSKDKKGPCESFEAYFYQVQKIWHLFKTN
jgi:hypothetical protein